MQRVSPRLFRLPALLKALTLGALLGASGACLNAESESQVPAGIGSVVDSVTAKGITYLHPKVLRITRKGVTIQHASGLASLAWTDLPDTWRRALASQMAPDPTPLPTPLPKRRVTPNPTAATPTPTAAPKISKPLRGLLEQTDHPVEIRPSVDLRQDSLKLGLYVKNQGHRPSCSVYAIISALEIQCSLKQGKAIRFSEESLFAATRKLSAPRDSSTADDPQYQDAGYSLGQVIEAVHADGLRVLEGPAPGILEESFDSQQTGAPWRSPVEFHELSLVDRRQTAEYLVRLLNEHYALPIGLNWPPARAVAGGLLDSQKPEANSRHAVTLIGYDNTTGSLEDTVFIFKNSYGPSWGASGFGRVTYRYLVENLEVAVVLDTP